MGDAPLLLRRAGAPKQDLPVPTAVPVKSLRAGDSVVATAGAEKISASTLPIYTVLPTHQFR